MIWFSERPHLSMSWCETLPPVDSDQRVLLYRDVKLEEAWLLQPELRTPEHPWRNVLTHPLPDIHLSDIKGVVLLMEDGGSSWKTETWKKSSSEQLSLAYTDMCSEQRSLITFRFLQALK